MNQREKAAFLIEMAEAMLTLEMQKSSAIGPDKINSLLIELTKIGKAWTTRSWTSSRTNQCDDRVGALT